VIPCAAARLGRKAAFRGESEKPQGSADCALRYRLRYRPMEVLAKVKIERVSRREIVLRLLSGMAAGVGLPLVGSSHPLYRLLADSDTLDRAEEMREAVDWKPLFLNAEQDKTLAALSEAVVPGSASAKVNQFIDLLLSVDTAEHRRDFVGSLMGVDEDAKKRFGRGFAALGQNEQVIVVTDFSGQDAHRSEFENLKEWIVGAYYSSEQGMRELGWNGNYAFENYPGCEHGEH
jgi:hypothetical protein